MPDPQFVDFKKVLRSHIKLGNAYQPRQIARMILQRLYNRRKDLIYPTFSFLLPPIASLRSWRESPDSAGIDFLSRRRVNCDRERDYITRGRGNRRNFWQSWQNTYVIDLTAIRFLYAKEQWVCTSRFALRDGMLPYLSTFVRFGKVKSAR